MCIYSLKYIWIIIRTDRSFHLIFFIFCVCRHTVNLFLRQLILYMCLPVNSGFHYMHHFRILKCIWYKLHSQWTKVVERFQCLLYISCKNVFFFKIICKIRLWSDFNKIFTIKNTNETLIWKLRLVMYIPYSAYGGK